MRPQVISMSNNAICPSCTQLPKDTEHFLKCNHPERKPAFQQMHQELQKLFQKHHINWHMFQIVWQGIKLVMTDIILPPPEDQYAAIFVDLFLNQQQLGWKQVMYGQISWSWVSYIDDTPNNTNGTVFFAKVIQHVWQYIISTWHIHNWHLHNKTQRYNQISLESAIWKIFHDAEQHLITASLIWDQMPKSILECPIKLFQNWAKSSATFMHDQVTAATKRANWTLETSGHSSQPDPILQIHLEQTCLTKIYSDLHS